MRNIVIFISLFGLIACTKKSDSLFIYTTFEEPLAQQLVTAYEKETGSKIEFVRLGTGEAAARIDAEKSNPHSSLWLGGVGLGHEQLKQKGLSIPYSPKGTEKIESKFKDAEGYWTGIYIGVVAFASSKDRLQKLGVAAPQSWADLLNPKFKKEIQLANPASSGTSYTVLSSWIQSAGEEKAMDYFSKLNANIAQYPKSGSAPAKSVSVGEATVAIGFAHDMIRLRDESKAPLQITFPSEGSGYEIASISLLKGAPQIEAAKKFYDWMYSKTASQILADYYVVPLIREGVQLKADAFRPEELKLIDVNVEWAGKSRDHILQMWNDKIKG